MWGIFGGASKKPASIQTNSNPESSNDEGRTLVLSQPTTQPGRANESNVVLNDPNMSKSWGLSNADANKAWSVTQGSRDIVVAVIDTGIDVNHRDLKNNLWVNPGETGKDKAGNDKATNGIDDDKNGFVDDVHGWNFVAENHSLVDNHGHGTHIAGIIGAEGGNNFGISGVSPKVSLMILKYYDPLSTGANNLKNTIRAIDYAVKMGARIINYSGGGVEYSKDEFDAVKSAEAKGILFVAAAGNERSNSDVAHYYPANYGFSNIISVTAIDPKLETLPSSNYGKKSVDLAAPGLDIYSTLPGNQFGTMTGTSQATAFVSGVAALIMSHFPTFTAREVKKYILRTGDESETLRLKTGTARKLNIYKALTTLDRNVGVNGVVVENGQQIEVLADPNDRTPANRDSLTEVKDFGKNMLKSINGEKSSARPDARNNESVDPNL